jgi:hypothetical protein
VGLKEILNSLPGTGHSEEGGAWLLESTSVSLNLSSHCMGQVSLTTTKVLGREKSLPRDVSTCWRLETCTVSSTCPVCPFQRGVPLRGLSAFSSSSERLQISHPSNQPNLALIPELDSELASLSHGSFRG